MSKLYKLSQSETLFTYENIHIKRISSSGSTTSSTLHFFTKGAIKFPIIFTSNYRNVRAPTSAAACDVAFAH